MCFKNCPFSHAARSWNQGVATHFYQTRASQFFWFAHTLCHYFLALLVFLCIANYYKLRCLKQHPYVSSHFCGSEVWPSYGCISCPGPHNAMVSVSARLCCHLELGSLFWAMWLWQNSVLCVVGLSPRFSWRVLHEDTFNSCWLSALLTTWPPPSPKPAVETSCAKPHSYLSGENTEVFYYTFYYTFRNYTFLNLLLSSLTS